ncbi:hypothetical protein NP233_g11504 [Leucocoprinus birnbaumii]|uniref:Uncharacterized protein n=1 Tax=Leucocoprinus birnbaumii TaxID=56174 RepID=A0AAD5VMF1_9AGAR|nr:hypothetical protein NP233_g11504 [Leucocoprinus birnbaumii]
MATSHRRDRSHRGPDGLTKDQRYYRSKRQKKKKEPSQPPSEISLARVEGNDLMLGHALGMGVSWPYSPIDQSTYPEMCRFSIIFKLVSKWALKWGGMENWGDELQAGYEHARDDRTEDDWYDDVWTHAHNGRALQNRLSELRGILPTEQHIIRELYRREVEASILLAKGITIIEIRVPMFYNLCSVNPRGISPLPPSSDLEWDD